MKSLKRNTSARGLLNGSRVFLRPLKFGDRDRFTELNRASIQFHQGLVDPPTQPSQFAAFLKHFRRPNHKGLLIYRKDDEAMVGAIFLTNIMRGGLQSAYLGYFVGEQFAGQGYMTEALQLTLPYAFRHLKLHRVEANIQPENTASIALVRRIGFTQEGFSRRIFKIAGRWRDHQRWAILAEDWQSHRQRGQK